MNKTVDETTYEHYLSALLSGNKEDCARIVQTLVSEGVELKNLYTHLFQRSQYQVGELWEHQKISVAVEHLSTAITGRILTLLHVGQVFSSLARDQTIIIACVPDDYHQLGARMVADYCELLGWRAYFLGANTPLTDLMQQIEERKPDLLGLSLSIYFNLPALLNALDVVTRKYPKLPILVGGQAFCWGAENAVRAYPQVSYMSTLDDLERRMMNHEK